MCGDERGALIIGQSHVDCKTRVDVRAVECSWEADPAVYFLAALRRRSCRRS
jgi:hypothetical protein